MPINDDFHELAAIKEAEQSILPGRMTLAAVAKDWGEAISAFDPVTAKMIVETPEGQNALEAFAKVAAYTNAIPEETLSIDRRWVEDLAAIPQEKGAILANAVNSALMALAAGADKEDINGGRFAEEVIRLTFADSVAIERARNVTRGFPLDKDDVLMRGKPGPDVDGPLGPRVDPRLPPEFRESFRRFVEIGAIRDLIGALNNVGLAVNAVPKPQEKAGSRIDRLEDPRACLAAAGTAEVALVGAGFESQRAGDAVYAEDTKLEVVSWTDDRIVVRIPQGFAGRYCISVLENTGATDAQGLANIVTAAQEYDSVAGLFTWTHKPISPGIIAVYTPRARCGANNQLWVGPPRIDRLQAAGIDAPGPVTWRPRRPLKITWTVTEADSVSLSIQPAAGTTLAQLPILANATQLPPTGQYEIPQRIERAPWSARVTLSARNQCGIAERNFDLNFSPQVGFVAVGAGSRSIFHVGVLAYTRPFFTQSFAVTGGSGLGAVAAVHAAKAPNAAALEAFWESLSTSGQLFPRLGSAESAFNDFKDGSYANLLGAVRDFADEVLLRYASQPGAPAGITVLGLTADQTAKDVGKVLLKSLPYAIKVASSILKGLDVKPGSAIVSAFEAPASIVSEASLAPQVQQAFTTAVRSGLPLIIGAVNPIAGAAVGLVMTIVFEIAAAIEREDERRRFLAAIGLLGVADATQFHAAMDRWLAAVGLSGGPVAIGTPIRLSVGLLESGTTSYINQRGLVNSAPNTPAASGTIVPASWPMLMRAATALPGLVPPGFVPTGNAGNTISLVDGATTEPCPLAAVIDAGADEVIVSMPVRMNLQSTPSFSGQNFIAVMRRAALMREGSFANASVDAFSQWRDTLPQTLDVGDYNAGLHVVDATIELPYLRALETDPGLLDIWRDYGYMRAFDTLAPTLLEPDRPGVDPVDLMEKRALMIMRLDSASSNIALLRITAWEMEHALFAVGLPGDSGFNAKIGVSDSWQAAEPLRRLKNFVAEEVRARLLLVKQMYAAAPTGKRWPGPATPLNPQVWANLFERHAWSVRTVLTDGNSIPSGPFERLIFFSLPQVSDTRPTLPPVETGRVEPATLPIIDPALFSQ